MLDTDLYMACIDLKGRRALVVGGDAAVAEKAAALIACGATVRVVAPSLGEEMQRLVGTSRITWQQKVYESSDLDGHLLVIASSGDREENERIYSDADARGMLVNVVDVPDLCNFISPAITRRFPIAVAVTTSGASPALAQRIRKEIEAQVDDAYASLARMLDAERGWAKSNLPTYAARRHFFASIVGGDPDPIELLRAGDRPGVERLIEAAKEEAVQ